MKQFSNIMVLMMFLSIVSCDVMDSKKLYIYNGTNDTLLCFWTPDNYIKLENNPLNSIIEIQDNDTIWNKSNTIIFPKDESRFSTYNWKRTISESKTKKLYIICYKVSTILKKWDQLKKTKLTGDTSFIYTYDELEKLNWKIKIKTKR